MDLDIQKINGQLAQLSAVTVRAQTVIKSAEKAQWPYEHLNHAQRLFCATLAAQARDLAVEAARKLGLSLGADDAETRQSTVETFMRESARFVGTDADSNATARIAVVSALLQTSVDLVARAERVLESEESISGQPIRHGALWYK